MARGFELAGHQILHRALERRVLTHHEGAVAAQFEDRPLASPRGNAGQPLARLGGTGEAEGADSVVGEQGLDRCVVPRSDQLNEIVRARLMEGLHEGPGAQDAESGGLDQGGGARRQGRPDLAGETGQGIVERGDEQRRAVGHLADQAPGLRPPLEAQLVEGGARGGQKRRRVVDLVQRLPGFLADLLDDERGQLPPPAGQRFGAAGEHLAPPVDRLQTFEAALRDRDRAGHFGVRRGLPVGEDAPGVWRQGGQGRGHG